VTVAWRSIALVAVKSRYAQYWDGRLTVVEAAGAILRAGGGTSTTTFSLPKTLAAGTVSRS